MLSGPSSEGGAVRSSVVPEVVMLTLIEPKPISSSVPGNYFADELSCDMGDLLAGLSRATELEIYTAEDGKHDSGRQALCTHNSSRESTYFSPAVTRVS